MSTCSIVRWLPFLLLFLSIQTKGDDWPQWRGPNRDNRSQESGLLKAWPEQGPPLVYQIEGLGSGIAPIAIVGDRGYTLSEFEGYQYVLSFDANTGQRLWLTPIGIQSTDSIAHFRLMRWLSQRMPNVYDGKVYAVTDYGVLVCLAADDGRLLWVKDYRQEYGVRSQVFGYCDYPLVNGDDLICVPGGEQATVVALDRHTGSEKWRRILAPDAATRRQDSFQRSAYAATLRGQHQEQGYYVITTNYAIHILAEADGTPLAKYSGVSASTANSHTALFDNDDLLVTNGYAGGISRLSVESTSSGLRLKEQFHRPFRFDAFQDIGLIVKNKLYQNRNGKVLARIDPATGEELNHRPMGGRFALTYADGRLYVVDINGQVSLIDPDTEDLEPGATFQLPEIKPASGVTMPVLANRKLYLRFDDRLFCFDVAAEPSQPVLDQIVRHQPPALDPSLFAPRLPVPIFMPTPPDVVTRMLQEGDLKPGRVLVDLGSGDGRIVVEAAKVFGATAIGYEINEELVAQARMAIDDAGLNDLAKIEASDMYEADLKNVNVLAVYLYPVVMDHLKKQIADMPDGALVISHQFQFSNIEADKIIRLQSQYSGEHHTIYMYRLPLKESKK